MSIRSDRLAVLSLVLIGALSACDTQVFNFGEKRLAPASGSWIREDVSDREKQRDIRACHEVAQAQVARDRRIDSGIAATQSQTTTTDDTQALQDSMQTFGYERRENSIFAQCMRDKGYSQA